MHEASIVQSLLELAEDYCKLNNYTKIKSMKIRVGALSGVMPEAMDFAYEAMKPGTMAEDASLIIETVIAQGVCSECAKVFEVDGPYMLECPECGSFGFTVTKGRELELSEMEVD